MRFAGLVRGELWALKRNRRILMFMAMMLGMAAIYALDAQGTSTFLPVVLIVAIYAGIWQMTVNSLVEEKERRTLEALLVTPARPLEIIGAKAFVGVLLAASCAPDPARLPAAAAGAAGAAGGLALAIGFATASGALVGHRGPRPEDLVPLPDAGAGRAGRRNHHPLAGVRPGPSPRSCAGFPPGRCRS